jgi:hypothetical protein
MIFIKNINKLRRSQILNIFKKNLLQNKNKNLKMTKFTTKSHMWKNIINNTIS